jgi:hypothetical protein
MKPASAPPNATAASAIKAEAELKLVDSARFSIAITEFIEWRTFAYWVRLVVEIDGAISSKMQALSMSDVLVLLAIRLHTANLIPTRESLSGPGSSIGSTTTFSSSQTRRDGGTPSAFMPPEIPVLTACGSIGFSVMTIGNARPRRLPSLYDWRQAAEAR